jgi:hypothetical protein
MKSFYDARPHTTVDGRIVYKRRKHFFSAADAFRVLSALPAEVDAQNEQKLMAIAISAMIRYSRSRSFGSNANTQGFPPIEHEPSWMQPEYEKLLIGISAAAIISRGELDKFRVAIALNI